MQAAGLFAKAAGLDPGEGVRIHLQKNIPVAAGLGGGSGNAAVEQVRPLCEAVRERGAEAVREATARFDSVDLASTIVPPVALADALAGLDDELRAALTEAARRARLVHQAQRPAETWTAVAAATTPSTMAPICQFCALAPSVNANSSAGNRCIIDFAIALAICFSHRFDNSAMEAGLWKSI